MLASAMSSSSIGAWPHHSDRRWPRISASSASAQHVADQRRLGDGDRWSSAITCARLRRARRRTSGGDRSCWPAGSNSMPLSAGSEAMMAVRRHHPDRQPLAAPRVDVARRLQRHFGVGRVQRADMLVRQPVAAADEHLPERQFCVVMALLAVTPAVRRARRFSAWRQRRPRAPRRRPHAPCGAPPAARGCTGRCRRARCLNSSQSIGADIASARSPRRAAASGSGMVSPRNCGLRHGRVDEFLAQLVVGEALDLPARRAVGMLAVARPAGRTSSGTATTSGSARPAPSPSAPPCRAHSVSMIS